MNQPEVTSSTYANDFAEIIFSQVVGTGELSCYLHDKRSNKMYTHKDFKLRNTLDDGIRRFKFTNGVMFEVSFISDDPPRYDGKELQENVTVDGTFYGYYLRSSVK